MEKTEVYSWRLDAALKSALESAARAAGTSVSRLLDRIAAEWLERSRTADDGDEVQARTRAAAMRYVGSIRGKDSRRAATASQRVRSILREKHARRRAG